MEHLKLAIEGLEGELERVLYDIHHGALEFIAKDTEPTDCWDVCDEKLGILREQQQLFLRQGDVEAMKKVSNHSGLLKRDREGVCVTPQVSSRCDRRGLKAGSGRGLETADSGEETRAPGVDRQFLASQGRIPSRERLLQLNPHKF